MCHRSANICFSPLFGTKTTATRTASARGVGRSADALCVNAECFFAFLIESEREKPAERRRENRARAIRNNKRVAYRKRQCFRRRRPRRRCPFFSLLVFSFCMSQSGVSKRETEKRGGRGSSPRCYKGLRRSRQSASKATTHENLVFPSCSIRPHPHVSHIDGSFCGESCPPVDAQ